MSTVSTVLNFARAQSQTDSNGLTDANGLIFANEALLDFRRRLVDKSVDAAQTQEAYRDGTSGVGTYLYPTNPALLFLKAIEINYANTNETDYKLAQQVDVSNLSGQTSFSWLRKNGSRQYPQFDDRGDWFEIFPTPTGDDNLTSLIRIVYFSQPSEYSATTDTISYPESIDYRILGWRVTANYLYSLLKLPEGDAFMKRYEERVIQLIGTLGRGTQQPILAKTIPLSGWEF